MKKKPETERPNPRRPQLWMGTESPSGCERLRVLYPNGETGWAPSLLIATRYDRGTSAYWDKANPWLSPFKPCWQPKKRMSFRERVKLMRAYDKKRGAETIFLMNM